MGTQVAKWLALNDSPSRSGTSRSNAAGVAGYALVGIGCAEHKGMPPKVALQNNASTEAFTGLTIALAFEAAVPLAQPVWHILLGVPRVQ